MRQCLRPRWSHLALATFGLACTMCARAETAPFSGGFAGSDSNTEGSGWRSGDTGSGDTPGLRQESLGNPCEAEDAPPECKVVAPPACGDGEINLDPPEDCDDGNSLPGDGCSGACVVEPYFACPTPGEPCVSTIVCGDGEMGPGEACDDGNQAKGDGCAADCHQIEIGYSCRTAGAPCIRVYTCGDGIVDPNEGCDDANTEVGDGCDTRCRMEDGFKCEGDPSVCSATTCGDGIREGAESCDDGNAVPFDGCSATCRAEPICETGKSCTSSCGDGISFNTEECDDGNLRDGDGCSSACQVETGFICTQEGEECQGEACFLELPIVYRDFSAAHSDFGVLCATIERGIAKPRLSAGGKPELSAASFIDACIASSASYAEWYMSSKSNAEAMGSIRLYPNGDGGYVNRYGANGEPYITTIDPGTERGGYGNDLDSCHATCNQRTRDSLQCENVCRPEHDAVAQATRELAQEQSSLAPIQARIADLEAQLATQEETAAECVADCAAPCIADVCSAEHDAVAQATLELTQEQAALVPDPIRIAEVEAQLAVLEEAAAECDADCGAPCIEGVCRPEHDAVAQTTQALAQQQGYLTPHVDRIAELEVQIPPLEETAAECDADCAAEFAIRAAECQALCGPCSYNDEQWCIGGEVVALDGNPMFFPVENLMNSTADMEVAAIPHEVYGGRWADDPSGTVRNFHFTSEIAYWFEYTEGMTASLSFTGDDDMWVFINGRLAVDLGGLHVPVEGAFTLNADGTIDQIHGTDGTADENERETSTIADFGLEAGHVYEVKVFQAERKKTGSTYKLTLSGFNAGASDCVTDCGDGEIGPGEECDDGVGNNLGGYNQCSPDCTLGPHCGDGVKQEEEACDYGTALNTGEYGGCAANCQLGPHCGDGITTDGEACDDGINDGGYGECATGCVLGPYCGDGGWQPEHEECDDGNNENLDGCSSACKIELAVLK